MNVDADTIRRNAEKALELIAKIRKVGVPKSIRQAVKDGWVEEAASVAEDVMERVPKSEMREWEKRVVTIEQANKVMIECESQLVRQYVADVGSPLGIAIRSVASVPKFVLSHIDDIYIVMLPIVSKAIPEAFIAAHEELVEGVVNGVVRGTVGLANYVEEATDKVLFWRRGVHQYSAPPNPSETIMPDLDSDLKTRKEKMDALMASAMILVTWWSVQRLIGLAQTLAQFKAKIARVEKISKDAREDVKKKALPQKSPTRKLTVKRSRR